MPKRSRRRVKVKMDPKKGVLYEGLVKPHEKSHGQTAEFIGDLRGVKGKLPRGCGVTGRISNRPRGSTVSDETDALVERRARAVPVPESLYVAGRENRPPFGRRPTGFTAHGKEGDVVPWI